MSTPQEIRVEGLHRSFGANQVLRGIDLVVHRGEIVAIVGGSGSGKTVLLEHIIGHMRPDRGHVLVANHDLPGAPLVDLAALDPDDMDRLRRYWAVVFQRNALFSGTVRDNIALWLHEVARLPDGEIEQRARASLEAVGLIPDTVLNVDRDRLSGGMAKRVALARALAMDPIIMFYDEPTAGLDPGHAARIQDLICQTHRQGRAGADGSPMPRTTLIITHDKDLLYRLRPRVVMLHEGRVFFDGPYDEFARSDSPVIRPYMELMPVLQKRNADADAVAQAAGEGCAGRV